MISNKIVAFLLLFFATSLYAQDMSGSRRLYFAGDLKVGYGAMESEDTTSIKSRDMISYSAEASAGIRFFHMIFGANAEYSLIRQLTKPSEVSNSNTQGKSLAISPLFGVEFYVFKLLFKAPKVLSGDYTFDKKASNGDEVVYKDADKMAVQLHWLRTPYSFWGVEYQKTTFKKSSKGGVETTLADSKRLNFTSISLLYGYTY